MLSPLEHFLRSELDRNENILALHKIVVFGKVVDSSQSIVDVHTPIPFFKLGRANKQKISLKTKQTNKK